jgi:hypothetical protein
MGTRLTVAVAGLAVAITTPAAAQTFNYGDRAVVKDVSAVTWTATAEAGVIVTTGNSRTTTATATATAIRLDPKNKLEVQLAGAYARARLRVPVDADGDGLIGEDEIEDVATTAAESWVTKLRYDRFLTELDALYVALLASADEPAGKQLVAGAQGGYSRSLYKDAQHAVLGEAGYDFSYEDPVVGDGVAIHSARVFAGYKGTIDDKTAIEGSVEALANVNTLNTAAGEAGPLDDTRLNSLAALTTKITPDVALSVSITAKYDRFPSPLPPLALPYEPGFVPLAEKLDTIMKATLIVSLF